MADKILLDLICHYEGLGPNVKDGKCYPYKCPAGYPTIGYGHVIRPGESFKQGLDIANARTLLKEDLRTRFEPAVDKMVKFVKLQPHERAALISFAYNLGPGALLGSTLLKLLNLGKREKAAEEFPKWCKANINGVLKPLAGLVFRRATEKHLFLTGDLDLCKSYADIARLGQEEIDYATTHPDVNQVVLKMVPLRTEPTGHVFALYTRPPLGKRA